MPCPPQEVWQLEMELALAALASKLCWWSEIVIRETVPFKELRVSKSNWVGRITLDITENESAVCSGSHADSSPYLSTGLNRRLDHDQSSGQNKSRGSPGSAIEQLECWIYTTSQADVICSMNSLLNEAPGRARMNQRKAWFSCFSLRALDQLFGVSREEGSRPIGPRLHLIA